MTGGDKASTILEVSCGIGTQSLGLAMPGYEITASDLSPEAVERARIEAEKRDINISLSVADMREAFSHHGRQFDIVISCDNAIPHLLTDADILLALQQMYECTFPGGYCIISVRDYEMEDSQEQKIKPYGIRQENDIRYLIFQVWDLRSEIYDISFYFVEDRGESRCETQVLHTQYYAIGIPRLIELMRQAGLEEIKRLDDRFFQPAITATRQE